MASNPIEYRIEPSEDKDQPFYVLVVDVGGSTERNLASSETYTTKAAANGMIEAVVAGNVTYGTFKSGDKWMWRVKSTNGLRLLRSAYSFGTQGEATVRARYLMSNAAGGETVDNA